MKHVDTIIEIEDQLGELEDELLMRKNSPNVMTYIHTRRLDHTRMKRVVLSFREEYNNLLHNTNRLIKGENMIYFDDYDDRLRTTLSNLESLHESLVSLLDVYYNNNNLKMNEIMTRLTVVSTIFIPLTFIAGVWGMNFDLMPELGWQYGYLGAWVTFIVIAIIASIFLKKKKWF